MSQIPKIKKRKFKTGALISKLIGLSFLAASGFLLLSVVNEIQLTFTLTQELNAAEAEKEKLLDENKFLEEQKEKLTNPEYVQSIARGQYQLSYDSEQIFILPEAGTEIEPTN